MVVRVKRALYLVHGLLQRRAFCTLVLLFMYMCTYNMHPSIYSSFPCSCTCMVPVVASNRPLPYTLSFSMQDCYRLVTESIIPSVCMVRMHACICLDEKVLGWVGDWKKRIRIYIQKFLAISEGEN